MHVTSRTLNDLGFPDVLHALAQRCRTDMGRERALGRPFLDTQDEVADALTRVEEARRLLQEPLSLPLGGVEDVRPALERASKRSMLEPRELLAIARLLFAFESTREVLEEREHTLPRLAALGRQLPLLEPLARRLDRSFEPDGTISDRASPALKEARDRTRGLHRHIKGRLEDMLRDERFVVNLRESYFSVRNGRYVVPVLSQMRGEVPGIVHNASQSGQTLFVEPEVLVGLGNDLAIATAMMEEEERRVLQELTEAVGREAARIQTGVAALGELDEAEGASVLSADLNAHVPDISPDATVELKALRHPRLLLKGGEVVANDVFLSNEARALVISGPNAGGKTVTLTAVGLCALMLRAGLPIPASGGSRVPLFRSVHSSVGDAQDLEQGLSTFSAHVVELRKIAEESGEGALALIDEIAADTDPREGAAIAIAVLEDLLARGATVLVTTHLEELKALAHADPRFVNARVGFDSRRMAPTYKLQLGAAGASSAIDIAARMGLAEAIISRARELAMGSGGPLTRAIHATEEERRRLAEEREKMETAAREAEERAARLAREQEAFERQRREAQVRFYEDVKTATQAALEEVKALVATLKQQANEKQAAQARAELQSRVEDIQRRTQQMRAEMAVGALAQAPVTLRVGGWVHHHGLDRDVEVLELGEDDALIAAGPLKMRVPLEELGHSHKGRPQQAKFPTGDRRGAALERAEKARAAEVKGANLRVDVRGMRADDAIKELEEALDRGMRMGEDAAMVVHGHGTGALKQAIREYLAASPYVRMYRPGEAHEGGDGVTLISLRS